MVTWPKPTNSTVLEIKQQAVSLYGLFMDYELYVELSELISKRTEGENYHKVHDCWTKENGKFFAVWLRDRWVACKRIPSCQFIKCLLPPNVLDEFRESKLHYREPEALAAFRNTRLTIIERRKWEFFSLKDWIEICERIRRAPEMPGVLKIGDQGEHEVWAVCKKGMYWVALVWDVEKRLVIEGLGIEALLDAGMFPENPDIEDDD